MDKVGIGKKEKSEKIKEEREKVGVWKTLDINEWGGNEWNREWGEMMILITDL